MSLRGAASPHAWIWYAGTALSFLLGAGTKEVIVSMPAVVFAYDRVFLSASWREMVRRRGVMYLTLTVATTWFVISVSHYFSPSTKGLMGIGHAWITPWMYARTQAAVILHYLKLAIWPDKLCLDYCWPIMSLRETAHAVAIICVLVAASLGALLLRPRIGWLATSFFAILAPTSSVVPINDVAMEHRMYLPMACIVSLFVLAVDQLLCVASRRAGWSRRIHTIVFVFAVFLLAVMLGARTIVRNEDYKTPESIWKSAVSVRPDSHRAQYNLGAAFANKGNLREAFPYWRRAVDIMVERGQDEAAIDWYLVMLTDVYVGYVGAGRIGDARQLLLDVSNKRPQAAYPHLLLGQSFAKEGRHELAAREFETALRQNPQSRDAQLLLATAMLEMDKPERAVELLRTVAERSPADLGAQNYLAWILAAHPDPRIRNGEEAVRITDDICLARKATDSNSWGTLAGAYAEVGRFKAAVWASRRSVEYCQRPGDTGKLDRAKEQLRCYQQGRPYRMRMDEMDSKGPKSHREGNIPFAPNLGARP